MKEKYLEYFMNKVLTTACHPHLEVTQVNCTEESDNSPADSKSNWLNQFGEELLVCVQDIPAEIVSYMQLLNIMIIV